MSKPVKRAGREKVAARRAAVLAYGPDLPPFIQICDAMRDEYGMTGDMLDKDIKWLRDQGHKLKATRKMGLKRSLTDKERGEARRMAKEGMTPSDIALKLGRSASTIRLICKDQLSEQPYTKAVFDTEFTQVWGKVISTTKSDTLLQAKRFQKAYRRSAEKYTALARSRHAVSAAA